MHTSIFVFSDTSLLLVFTVCKTPVILHRKENIFSVLLDFKLYLGSFLTPTMQNSQIYVYAAKAIY